MSVDAETRRTRSAAEYEEKVAAPERESRREKFKRIAGGRTKLAIKAIRRIAIMGGKNRYAYEFDAEDVERIVDALTEEVEHLRALMIPPARQTDIEFDL